LVDCPPIVGPNKTIYASFNHKSFCALDGRTGAVQWRFECKPETRRQWAPGEAEVGPQNTFSGFDGAGALAKDGTLYITSLEGNLYALDSKTGEEKWRFSTHYQLYSSPTIGDDATIFFTAIGTLYAINSQTGKKLWDRPHCDVRGPVALGPNGTLYVTTYVPLNDGKHYTCSVTALDGRDGGRNWELPLGQGGAAPPVVGDDSIVYVGYQDNFQGPSHGRVIAINGKTGRQCWIFETKGGSFLAPAIGADGTVYIGSKGGVMYALNGTTGAKKWEQDIGAEIGTPVAVGSNGLIYFGANDGTVYALRAKDGAMAARPQ
jgi:outer membrane protein assembly factor BamB